MKLRSPGGAGQGRKGAVLLMLMLALTFNAVAPAAARAAEPPKPIDPVVADLMADKKLGLVEATRRIGWQRRADALSSAAEMALGRKRFGGVWIADDQRVTVGVRTEATSLMAAASTVATLATGVGLESAGFTVAPVRHSLTELSRANDWLARRVEAANKGAKSRLRAGGYRPSDGSVALGIPAAPAELTSTQQAAVEDARRELGDMLVTESTTREGQALACSAQYCDPPLRGGVRFNYPGGSCTAGFIGHHVPSGEPHVITAGHCLRGHLGHNITSRYSSVSSEVRIGEGRKWVWDARGDVGVFSIENGSWRHRAWLYVTASPDNGPIVGTTRNESYPIRGVGGNRAGYRVCKRGAFSATQCGAITQVNASLNYDGVTVNGLARANFCAVTGDSGGPVFDGNLAYGLVAAAGNNSCDIYYQGISGAQALMNFRVGIDP